MKKGKKQVSFKLETTKSATKGSKKGTYVMRTVTVYTEDTDFKQLQEVYKQFSHVKKETETKVAAFQKVVNIASVDDELKPILKDLIANLDAIRTPIEELTRTCTSLEESIKACEEAK